MLYKKLDYDLLIRNGKVVDGSGLGRDPKTIVANNDQFARLVLLEGDACPTAASDVMAKLNRKIVAFVLTDPDLRL